MQIPKYNQFHLPILRHLADGQPHTAKDIRKTMRQQFNLTEAEASAVVPSGKQTLLANRSGWSCVYLKKAGLIDTTARGVYIITAEGKRVAAQDLTAIDNTFLSQYPAFVEFQRSSVSSSTASDPINDDETPEDIIAGAFAKIEQELIDNILAEVMKLSDTTFERFVLDLLIKLGYGTSTESNTTTAVTGDSGIDGVIREDKLGFNLIYMQAKHWALDRVIGRPEVQGFYGAIPESGGKSLFVTTAKFSDPAREYAKARHIILIDGPRLAQLMIEHDFGVNAKATFSIKMLDTSLFDEYQNL